MKVGIMSMHRIPNYGSFMQAYSLKKMIESLDHEVCFVDYQVEPSITKRKRPDEWIKCFIKNKKREWFNRGIIDQILHKEEKEKDIMRSCNGLLEIDENYAFHCKVDVLVIGSDEVFNCTQAGENVGYSPELFGKNARAKKIITDAASFGDTTYDKLQRYGVTDDLMKWVSRINNISVRDNNSKEIITSLCKKTPIINLDTVLVGNIEKLKWKKPDLEYEYIVLYGYEYRFSKEECDKILHFAKSENCKVIALGERQFKSDIFIKCRPDEVLGYFSEAKYIITDTFHGSIFSIINHKKFVSLIRKATPQSSGNRQKLGFLLEQLYLQERLINSIDELSEKMHKNIDYVNVDKIREEERNKTMKYLENCIGER